MPLYRVSLRRVPKLCPSCHAARNIRTEAYYGTVVSPSCDPRRCRIARVIALAGYPRTAPFEPLPVDDRHVPKSRWAS